MAEIQETETFVVRLMPPKRKSVTHIQAYERMKRFLSYASRDDISEELKSIKPHKRVRYLVDKYEAEMNEHIPISKVYKALRNSEVISAEQTTNESLTISRSEPATTVAIEPNSYISEITKTICFESDD